jgi:hypothetical protein
MADNKEQTPYRIRLYRNLAGPTLARSFHEGETVRVPSDVPFELATKLLQTPVPGRCFYHAERVGG